MKVETTKHSTTDLKEGKENVYRAFHHTLWAQTMTTAQECNISAERAKQIVMVAMAKCLADAIASTQIAD